MCPLDLAGLGSFRVGVVLYCALDHPEWVPYVERVDRLFVRDQCRQYRPSTSECLWDPYVRALNLFSSGNLGRSRQTTNTPQTLDPGVPGRCGRTTRRFRSTRSRTELLCVKKRGFEIIAVRGIVNRKLKRGITRNLIFYRRKVPSKPGSSELKLRFDR